MQCVGLNGAEIVFNPSATVAGLSEYLWKLEQPAQRRGESILRRRDQSARHRRAVEDREFYGQSYFCDRAANARRRQA